jgi:predicted house-cleaning NTP pyrophosphatase (Maf/HAM1 superfamily)
VFVQRVRGSVSNVVGLPLHTLVRLAGELGVSLVG